MKINSELERVLLGEQQKAKKPTVAPDNSTKNAFGSMLESELEATSTVAQSGSLSVAENASKAGTTSRVVSEALSVPQKGTDNFASDDEVMNSLVSGIQNTLDGMDSYVQSLQGSVNLKQAWASLNNMSQHIGNMQKDYANLSRPNPGIGTMLNDLEVMAVTETYKFNRGDYL